MTLFWGKKILQRNEERKKISCRAFRREKNILPTKVARKKKLAFLHFYRVKYHPFSAAMLCGFWGCSLKSLENPNFNFSVKSIEAEMDKNGCFYFVSSLVPIESILRLHCCLVLAANFRQFVDQTENCTLTAFSNFRKFLKKKRIVGTFKCGFWK